MSAAAAAAAGEFSLTGAERLEPGTKDGAILFLEPFIAACGFVFGSIANKNKIEHSKLFGPTVEANKKNLQSP